MNVWQESDVPESFELVHHRHAVKCGGNGPYVNAVVCEDQLAVVVCLSCDSAVFWGVGDDDSCEYLRMFRASRHRNAEVRALESIEVME
jgi:hypothetical protein